MSKLIAGPAFGHPGNRANWASGRKSAVGRSVDHRSHVWFTIGDGILNEIYYPRADLPCTKDAGLIITDGGEFFSEERVDTHSEVQWAGPGVPAFRVTNTHKGGRYRVHKEIMSEPYGHVVFQRTRFEPLQGTLKDYHVFALAAPHLGDHGFHNTACAQTFKGTPVLVAESKECGMALGCSTGWLARSVGFEGKSDGWQDLSKHRRLTWHFDHARDGNVALTGEVHLDENGMFTLLLGFGRGTDDASSRLHSALFRDFDAVWNEYVAGWNGWLSKLPPPDEENGADRTAYFCSAAVLRIHEDEAFPGARVASLSFPWGEVRTQEMASGYHAVWPRDAAQSALGLLACGVKSAATGTLEYLQSVQEADGHWPQNMWVDGSAYWKAIQVDSIAAPLLLYEIARQEGVLDETRQAALWPLIHRAAVFICRNGPITEQDRWERTGGFSPYTLGMAIAALVIAAHAAQRRSETGLALYLFETADAWNAQIENWTWCAGTDRAKSAGVPGYYSRLIPAFHGGRPAFEAEYPTARSSGREWVRGCDVVSPDIWSLVRYGLRDPHDERIAFTTAVIDAALQVKMPHGPAWHRYDQDGYGETAEGDPFREKGIGRAWPLLTGERAHYELARGRHEQARELLATLESFACGIGLIPEQLWDADDIPEKQLRRGGPTGSARPLAWAHAEHLQLLRSIRDRRVFSCPRVVAERYVRDRTPARYTVWRPDLQTERLLPGTLLRLETPGPAQFKWSAGSQSGRSATCPSPVGLHFVDLTIPSGDSGTLVLTQAKNDVWENESHKIRLR